MYANAHLPDPSRLCCDGIYLEPGQISIVASTTPASAPCPACGVLSQRVHSRYTRELDDLPRHGTPVRLTLTARRFFCDNPNCARAIFVERLPSVADAHARKTSRLIEALCFIGFTAGGESGCRLAGHLGCHGAR